MTVRANLIALSVAACFPSLAYLGGLRGGGFVGDGQALRGRLAGRRGFGRLGHVPVWQDAVGKPHPPLIPGYGP